MQYKKLHIIPILCLAFLFSCKKGGQLGGFPPAYDDSEFNCGKEYYYDSVPINGLARYASISGEKNLYFFSYSGYVLKTDCDGNTLWQNPMSVSDPIIDFKAEVAGDGFYIVSSADSFFGANDSTVCYQRYNPCDTTVNGYQFETEGPATYTNNGGLLKVHKFDKNGQLIWRKDMSSNAYNTTGGTGLGSAIGLTNSGLYVLTYTTTNKNPIQNFTIAPSSSIPYYDFAQDQNTIVLTFLDNNGNVVRSKSLSDVKIRNFLTPSLSIGVSANRIVAIVEGLAYTFDHNLNFISKISPYNSNANCGEKSLFAKCNYRSAYTYYFGQQRLFNTPQYNYVSTYQGGIPFFQRQFTVPYYNLHGFDVDNYDNFYQVNDSTIVKENHIGQVIYKKSIPGHLLLSPPSSRHTVVKNNQVYFFLSNQYYVYIIKPNESGTY